MSVTKLLILTVMVVTSDSEHNLKDKMVNGYEFLEVVKSKYFVDKTLLVEEFLHELFRFEKLTKCRYVKVLAEEKFGKSTNLNMIKWFYSIKLDKNGTKLNFDSNNNDKLFSNNRLEILKRKEFMDKHFESYPVILINLKRLASVKSFKELLVILAGVVHDTFKEHEYLLSSSRLWEKLFNKDNFQLFFDKKYVEKLHKYTIYCSFSILSKILYNHFQKRVIVLIDDFDSFQESPAYTSISLKNEKKKITNFMGILLSDILLFNEFLFGSYLSGSSHLGKLYLKKISNSEKPYTDIPDASENNTHTLWKYYGLSRNELRTFLGRFIDEPERLSLAEDHIVYGNKSNSTSTYSSNPYSIWSVIKYLEENT